MDPMGMNNTQSKQSESIGSKWLKLHISMGIQFLYGSGQKQEFVLLQDYKHLSSIHGEQNIYIYVTVLPYFAAFIYTGQYIYIYMYILLKFKVSYTPFIFIHGNFFFNPRPGCRDVSHEKGLKCDLWCLQWTLMMDLWTVTWTHDHHWSVDPL